MLGALARAGHEIVLVLCQPDRPAGRGRTLQSPAVKRCAQTLGLPVYQPESLRTPQARETIARCGADLMLVVAYGLIIPADVLCLPRRGCINVHASLLPRWRGAAPIQRAIEAGDRQTGITIMQMDAGLDTGPMLLCKSIDIGERETGGQLHDRLADLGADLAVLALSALARDELVAHAQPEQGITYAHKIKPDDAVLDWGLDARSLANRIRAFDPTPGAQTRLSHAPEERLKIWSAHALEDPSDAAPGTVIEASTAGLVIACGGGRLVIDTLQRAGGRRMPVAAFLAGYSIKPGDRFVVVA